MNTTIDRLKVLFLGLFFVGAVAAWTYQFFWVRPAKQCESQQRWWDPSTRTCATPLYIPSMTGRPEGVSREDWARQQAAKAQLRDRLGEDGEAQAAGPAAKPAAEPKK
ncbi:MAG TPA: hypothetical protein VEA44_01430 [Caulobacter sp.]|nr:hypothetical protein [Caulobacter sp.]